MNPNLHLRIGPVVRLSPEDYSIADLDVAKHIYGPRTAYEKVDIQSSCKENGSPGTTH